MIDHIVSFVLRQRVFILVAIGLIAGAGIFAFKSLPIDAFPDVTNIQVQIITKAPGRSPRTKTGRCREQANPTGLHPMLCIHLRVQARDLLEVQLLHGVHGSVHQGAAARHAARARSAGEAQADRPQGGVGGRLQRDQPVGGDRACRGSERDG